MSADPLIAFLLGFAFCAVPASMIIAYLLKRSRDRVELEVRKELKAAKDEFGKLVIEQKRSYKALFNAHVDAKKKKAQAMPKPTHALKLVSSGGKRIYHENVVTADFRNKPKKGPDNSGPKSSA